MVESATLKSTHFLVEPIQTPRRPFVLVPCDSRTLGEHPFQVLGQKYIDAVRVQANCIVVPLLSDDLDALEAFLAIADGILLPGSTSNVHPSHFNQALNDPSLPLDPARDATTLFLIRRAIELGLPILAICRGLQEINTALGGSLHQAVQAVPGRIDHRGAGGRAGASADAMYADAHPIRCTTGGMLIDLLGADSAVVNSVHGQGIERLADGLRVEAVAPDGQIEAVSLLNHRNFSLAVQWHPEWRPAENSVSQRIFAAFGAACRDRRLRAT